MFLPIRTDSPLRTTPYMNWALIVVNVLIFVVQQARPELTTAWELSPRVPSVVNFFTYQFIHGSVLHIAGNMLFLYIFGNNVNDKMGNVGYLAFYLAGGIFAGICYVVGDRIGAPTLGASGSISAVTGAYLILFPRSHVTILYFFYLVGTYELQSMWVILIFFALDLIQNTGISPTGAASHDGVAHMAHIGGTVFGSVICLLLVVTHLLPRDQFDVWALAQRWNKRRQYRDLVSKGFNPFDHTQLPTRVGGRAAGRRMDDAAESEVHDLRSKINDAITQRKNDVAADLYGRLKALDGSQVMSKQAQLDIATHLHHAGQHARAAEAYESLLKAYPKVERVEQIELILGLLYSRDLRDYENAKRHLDRVVERVHDGRVLELAREGLAEIPPSAVSS